MRGVRMLVEAPVVKDVRSLLEDLCEDWPGMEWCELSVLLAATRALAQLHQSHHWQASGEAFYGDHLLFDRLYTATDEDVDKIAEKLVGLGTSEMVDAVAIAAQCHRILNELYGAQAKDISESSLAAEELYISIVQTVSIALDEQDRLTYGLDNMLADIADKHEEHVYLLKRKISQR
jgi:DNA-binding ferritin-like protein